ncbi:hypothetical protein [Clostridium botulinum]|uniref:hypothetical protein n=1 Tax=Clostridium botulinum TaxID=1491 RepID=UPI001C9A6C44|nr:hypothetical protein [Clostridium botulinum]MBY6838687.1 hypothetical protein [Clostridium botulinum]
MKLEQCQLDYLAERGGNYDRKYGMFNMLLGTIQEDIKSVIELFGGTGIQTYYLNNKYNLDNHIVIDKDIRCCNCIKKFNNNVQVVNKNVFEYEDNKNYDLVVCDSVFNKKEFNNIVSLLDKFKSKYIIITDTGVFNVRFNKNKTYDAYWNDMFYKLKERGYYILRIKYSSDFGMMLLTKIDYGLQDVSKLQKEEINTDWRNYRDLVLDYIKKGEIE